MPSPAQARVFVAASLPAELLDAIQDLQSRLSQTPACRGVRWSGRAQIHLTLKFFGNVASDQLESLEQSLRRAAQGVPAPRLAIQGIGCFPSFRQPRVVWLGLTGDVVALGGLQSRVDHATLAFGSHAETRAFQPHLTVGRIPGVGVDGRRLGQALEAAVVEELGAWRVGELKLIQSQLNPKGSSYTTLASVTLGEAETS